MHVCTVSHTGTRGTTSSTTKMSSDKSVEAVGCDASIMKNVWEIREREYEQKLKLEEQRLEQSALTTINQDWANRLLSKQPNYKRSERKAKPVEQVDEANIWKSKTPKPRPPPPTAASRGLGSGPSARPGIHTRSVLTSGKDKKVGDKAAHKLQLLAYVTKTQPSPMVWGKAWKYDKCVPPPPEGGEAVTDWGQCWMFATKQPVSEAGQNWPNGPGRTEPQDLYLWSKPGYRIVDSQELDLNLCNEEWKTSWKNPEKDSKDKGSAQGEKRMFASLVETQQHNEALCSSEWTNSWQSTKPATQEHQSAVPHHEANANMQDSYEAMSSEWDECWKHVNLYCSGNTRSPQGPKFKASQWVGSWKAATMVSGDIKCDTSMMVDQPKISNSHKPQDNFIVVPYERKTRIMDLEFGYEFKGSAEWNKSWQVSKTNSQPSEELAKVLKAPPPKCDTPMTVEQKPQVNYSASGDTSSDFTKLRLDVIFHPKREITHSMLLHLKYLEKVSSGSEWRDSWKMLKHRLRMERKRMRPEPSNPFRESNKEPNMNVAEWKNSWKFTSLPLHQNDQSWQQPWLRTRQVRVDRASASNHFEPANIHRNGPTKERSWTESWKFSRRQHRSEPDKNTEQRGSAVTSKQPEHRRMEHGEQLGYRRSVGTWQESWMFSETKNRPDSTSNPNQWSQAWRFSVFHTEQVNNYKWMNELMEIRPWRENLSLHRAQAKMSQSFDDKMFKELYPEKQWSSSWKSGPLLCQNLNQVSEGKRSLVSPLTDECGCKWGRSFRIANPMPKMEQKWVGTPPSPCYYEIMWSKCNKVHVNIDFSFTSNSRITKMWETSPMFLQSFLPKIKNVGGAKVSDDPCEIITKKIQLKKHLYLTIEKEIQAKNAQSIKKLAGCHLLGKTQPRPKRGAGSAKKTKLEEETNDKMMEEWVESWRVVLRPQMLKNQMKKSLVGWTESWKFLIPTYPVPITPKSK